MRGGWLPGYVPEPAQTRAPANAETAIISQHRRPDGDFAVQPNERLGPDGQGTGAAGVKQTSGITAGQLHGTFRVTSRHLHGACGTSTVPANQGTSKQATKSATANRVINKPTSHGGKPGGPPQSQALLENADTGIIYSIRMRLP